MGGALIEEHHDVDLVFDTAEGGVQKFFHAHGDAEFFFHFTGEAFVEAFSFLKFASRQVPCSAFVANEDQFAIQKANAFYRYRVPVCKKVGREPLPNRGQVKAF